MIFRKMTKEDIAWAIVSSVSSIENDRKESELINIEQMEMIAGLVVEQGTAIICEVDKRRVGLIGGLKLPNPLQPEQIILTSVLWYVTPEQRKGKVPYGLLSEYKTLNPGGDVLLSVPTRINIREESLSRIGFDLVEKQYKVRK